MTSSLQFRLDQFEGPLDLLLFLIKKNEVNIYDIPIASITEQYLQALASFRLSLEDATEFYYLAATLLHIKSRMLLPVEVELEEDWEDPRQELVSRLIEYQRYKKLSELMGKKEDTSQWTIERNPPLLPLGNEPHWEELEVWDLLESFSSLMKSFRSEQVVNLYEEVTVKEKLILIQELLENRGEFSFRDVLINPHSLLELICAFLAILELVKVRVIRIYQHRPFEDILIQAQGRGG